MQERGSLPWLGSVWCAWLEQGHRWGLQAPVPEAGNPHPPTPATQTSPPTPQTSCRLRICAKQEHSSQQDTAHTCCRLLQQVQMHKPMPPHANGLVSVLRHTNTGQPDKQVTSVPDVPQGNVVAEVYTCGLVKTDMCSFRFTSVYRAEAMVASGVLPWQLISSSSRANLQACTESFVLIYCFNVIALITHHSQRRHVLCHTLQPVLCKQEE